MREFELMDTVSFLCPPRMISQLTMLKSLEGMSCPISQARLVFLSQRNTAVFFIEIQMINFASVFLLRRMF